jgi:outer membrane lipoprotein-sorting protein
MAFAARKWTPAVVAVIVVAGVAVAIPAAANASVHLPHKSAAQVLELVASSKVTAFSGDITETSDLGLPSIPASAGGGSDSSLSSDLALLTGTNSLRVYVDGPNKVRLQQLGSLAEQDIIRNGSNVWTYDSKTNAVEHTTVRAGKRPTSTSGPTSENRVARTPDSIAKDLIARLRTSSTVSVDDAVRVAGRASYELVLTPKATDTLIGSVSIAVDAATGLPLRVQIDAAGQKDPAVSIGFSSLDLATPSASLFDFTAPKGSTVKELTKPKSSTAHAHPAAGSKPTTSVTGKGWDAVVTLTAKDSKTSLGELAKSPDFGELTTAVAGGRVFHTSLFTVLFTSDGRVVAGAVSVARLEAVAAQ